MNKKIAIPSAGSFVNAHFGRSQAFTLFEITNSEITSVEILDATGFEHQHAGIAQLLGSRGVKTVICGGIGPGAISGLEAFGLEVLRGADGPVRDVAAAYADGTLVTTDGVCEHHHDGHDHQHQH
ncbi:MAG: NifB/NifX family molybdenum-iron cluster-binding protein [Desulfitobacteriaceae bacterium]